MGDDRPCERCDLWGSLVLKLDNLPHPVDYLSLQDGVRDMSSDGAVVLLDCNGGVELGGCGG